VLTNLAVSNEANVEAMKDAGAIVPLISLLQESTVTEDTHQRAAWALSNMLVNEDVHEPFMQAGGIQIMISKLQKSKHKGLVSICADALGNVSTMYCNIMSDNFADHAI
jgi:hypothetical protein